MAVGLVVYAVVPFLIYWLVSVLPGLVKWYRTYRTVCMAVEQYPGDPTHWFWGTLHLFPGPDQRGLDFLAKNAEEYVKCNRFYLTALQPCLGVFHPETVKVVLQSTTPKDKEGLIAVYRLLSPWIGDGLITSNGEKWHRNRRLLTPAFHFGVLKPYCKIYNASANTLVSKWRQTSLSGRSIEIFEPVLGCTLETVLKCAFSYDGDIQSQIERGGNSYITAVNNIAPLVVNRLFAPHKFPDWSFYMSPDGRKFQHFIDIAHKTTKEVIAQRKATINDDKVSSQKKYKDFLDILLSAKDEDGKGLSDQEIREEVDTFLFAGHDTTGSAISWLLYNLARHPDIQTKVRAEVDALFESKDDDEISIEDLAQLEYLTQCIKESMRLHTVVTGVWRKLDRELEIDGRVLPVGTTVDVNIHALHHNPHVWGPDVNEYKPERFSSENRKTMDSFAFVPFSAGPRNCIGQNFAMNEIKVVIAKVLRSFILHIDNNYKTEAAMHIILRAKNGIWLRMDNRKH